MHFFGPAALRTDRYPLCAAQSVHKNTTATKMSHDDIWRRRKISFRGIAAVQAALRDPLLLSSYFDRVAEVLKMIEANSSTAGKAEIESLQRTA